MKISTTQSHLLGTLQRIGHVAGKRATLPILQNILFRAQGNVLSCIATNLEVGVSTTLRAKIHDEGTITIPARLLAEYIALLPDEQVDIETDELKIHITCKNHNTTILGASADEFPMLPERSSGVRVSVDARTLRDGIHAVVHAAFPDESRSEINGMLFVASGKKLTLVATDSFRLAEKHCALTEAAEGDVRAILPARSVAELARTLGDTEGAITLFFNENQLFLEAEDLTFTARLVNGQYPDYTQIIPTNHASRAVVDAHALTNAVKGTSLFSPSGVHDISIEFAPERRALIISASSGQVGENHVTVEGDVTGTPATIVFNWRYFIDGIEHANAETVTLDVVNATSPGVLRPKDKTDYTYLIMPIKQ